MFLGEWCLGVYYLHFKCMLQSLDEQHLDVTVSQAGGLLQQPGSVKPPLGSFQCCLSLLAVRIPQNSLVLLALTDILTNQ